MAWSRPGDAEIAVSAANWTEGTDGRAPQMGIGPAFLAPRTACALHGQGAAIVFDLGLGGLFHVDLVTGERSLVAF